MFDLPDFEDVDPAELDEPVKPPERGKYSVKAGQIEIPAVGVIYYPTEFCPMVECPYRDEKHPFSFYQLPEPLGWWVHSGCHRPTIYWWAAHFKGVVHITGEVPWDDVGEQVSV